MSPSHLNAELTRIVEHYVKHVRPRARREAQWFVSQPTLEEAIRVAALCLDEQGRKASHQWRVDQGAMDKAAAKLLAKKEQLAAQKSFAELHRMISELLRPVSGLGDLYLYDVAQRIGQKLGLKPPAVYLHAGTREGAKALGVDSSVRTLYPGELPAPLRVLDPDEIENLLCIYKDSLRAATQGRPFGLQDDSRCYLPEDDA